MSYVIDNGHPGSLEHKAEHYSDPYRNVCELVCACGWSVEGPMDEYTWEPVQATVDQWTAHVYQVTGQDAPVVADGFCEAPVQVQMGVASGSDLQMAWSCLQHADEFAAVLEAEYGSVPERAARAVPEMSCGHFGRIPDAVEDGVVVMDAVRAGGDL